MSRERVGDGGDWASESFGGTLADCDEGDAGDWGDWGDLVGSNFVCLASFSLSRSLPFTLAEVVLS